MERLLLTLVHRHFLDAVLRPALGRTTRTGSEHPDHPARDRTEISPCPAQPAFLIQRPQYHLWHHRPPEQPGPKYGSAVLRPFKIQPLRSRNGPGRTPA